MAALIRNFLEFHFWSRAKALADLASLPKMTQLENYIEHLQQEHTAMVLNRNPAPPLVAAPPPPPPQPPTPRREADSSPRLRLPLPVRIVTHNIRYAASASQRFKREAPWAHRRIPLSQQLHFLTRTLFTPASSIICLQEVLKEQFDDVKASLGDGWEGVGVGRDDGMDQGEMCAIFWRSEGWGECVHFETVWLNETGQVGRKGWDAGSVRVVSCVVLVEKAMMGRKLLVMNTHLDDQGRVARREGAKILVDVMARLKEEWKVDIWLLAGDLNSEEDGEAYKILNDEAGGFSDAFTLVKMNAEQAYGDVDTYTGFDGNGDGERTKRIDFVFVPGKGKQEEREAVVRGYAAMSNMVDGKRMSDHEAVVVDLVL